MRTSRCILAVSLVLAAACGRDAASPVAPAAPAEPLASTWTRTYEVSALTYTGTGLNRTLSLNSGGYVKVELVPDNSAMGAYELGTVESGGDVGYFYKPANNSVRLTAIPYSGCTFTRWRFPGAGSATATVNPINMDNYHSYYRVQGEFQC